jgi:hypothetical protein
MVQKVLFSELNLAVLTNHHWKSHVTKQRMFRSRNCYPEVEPYPIDPSIFHEKCDHLKDRKMRRALDGQKKDNSALWNKEEKLLIGERDSLILNTERGFPAYLKKIEDFFKGNRDIYSLRFREYPEIVGLSKNVEEDNKPNVASAFKVHDFMMDLLKKFTEKSDDTIAEEDWEKLKKANRHQSVPRQPRRASEVYDGPRRFEVPRTNILMTTRMGVSSTSMDKSMRSNRLSMWMPDAKNSFKSSMKPRKTIVRSRHNSPAPGTHAPAPNATSLGHPPPNVPPQQSPEVAHPKE